MCAVCGFGWYVVTVCVCCVYGMWWWWYYVRSVWCGGGSMCMMYVGGVWCGGVCGGRCLVVCDGRSMSL